MYLDLSDKAIKLHLLYCLPKVYSRSFTSNVFLEYPQTRVGHIR